MPGNKEEMIGLVFYAIDKSSPFDLARDDHTDSLIKIAAYLLADLHITGYGVRDMWQTINAYSHLYGGKIVPANVAAKCKTVEHVWKAVCAGAGIDATLGASK